MKQRTLLLPLIPMLACSGCMVTSLQPLYTEKDLVYWPELEGSWSDHESSEETYSFERESGSNNVYKVVYNGVDNENKVSLTMSGRLCEVGKRTYLDLEPSDVEADVDTCPSLALTRPMHVFYMIERTGDSFRLRAMSSAWAKERREMGRLWISHMADGDSTLLTADTQRVQRFLRKWQNSDEAWEDWSDPMHRVTPPG